MNIKKQVFIIIITLLLVSCSMFNKETDTSVLIEKDRQHLNEKVNTFPALIYKFIKVNSKISEMDSLHLIKLKENHPEIQDISKVFTEIESINSDDTELSALEYIKLFKAFNDAKNVIRTFNEDVLPSYSEIQEPNNNFTETEIKQNKTNEHIVFAILGLITRDLGTGSVFYELSMVNPETIPETESKIYITTLRNLMLFEKELYYLSEYEITENIDWIEANKQAKLNIELPFGTTKHMRERVLILNYLIRGLDRLKMDTEVSENEAMKDFEKIVEISKESGIDNELVQAVEVFFYLKNDNPEKAIIALNRLKKSKLLSQNEKESIDEAIIYLENRETGKVLNSVFDKIVLSKIIGNYLYANAKDMDWEKVLEKYGIHIPEIVKDKSKFINNLLKNINKYASDVDFIDTKEGIKNKGLDLLEKSKSLLE